MMLIAMDGNDWLLAIRHVTDIEKAKTLAEARRSAALAARYLRKPATRGKKKS